MIKPDTKAALLLIALGLFLLLCCPPIGSAIGAIMLAAVAGGAREARQKRKG